AEDLPLLLVGAEALVGARDDQGDPVAGDRHHAARRLLEEAAGVHQAAAGAAPALVDRHAEPAQLGELLVELLVVDLREPLREPLPLFAGADLPRAEVAQRGDEVALLVGESGRGAGSDLAHGCRGRYRTSALFSPPRCYSRRR